MAIRTFPTSCEVIILITPNAQHLLAAKPRIPTVKIICQLVLSVPELATSWSLGHHQLASKHQQGFN